MTNGESSEIPRHLKEGLPSANKYEEDVRRQYQIQDKRFQLQISERSFQENEMVRRYVTAVRDLEAMGNRLEGYGAPKSPQSVSQAFWAELLYRSGQHILENGLTRQYTPLDLESDLEQVAFGYGLRIDPPERWDGKLPDKYLQLEERSGLWTPTRYRDAQPEPPWELWKGRRDSTGWYWPDLGNERHDPEHVAALHAEADKQGIPGELVSFDPETHVLLSALHYGRELVAATENLGALPPAPGLTPSAHERLAQVAPLNRLAVALLEDVHQPGQLTAERAASELQQAVGPYELLVRGRSERQPR